MKEGQKPKEEQLELCDLGGPVSAMRNFGGLIQAYWTSERWLEAWLLTISIGLLTAASSKASVWMAVACGELLNSIVHIHDPHQTSALTVVISNAGLLILLMLLKEVAFVGFRHLLSTTLHRKWRGWLNNRFNEALLDQNHTHYHLQQGGGNNASQMPDNIDQRVQESIKGMTGGAIGLAMGVLGVVMSVLFVGQKLIEMSTEVSGLGFLGAYGTATLAFVAIATYVPFSTWIAMRIGRILETITVDMQKTEGSYRSEMTTFLRRSLQVAASNGENVQKTVNKKLYYGVDRAWARFTRYDACYMSFTSIYNYFAIRVVAYLPGLLPYISQSISLKNYITGAELVGSMINECSWFIQVMPAIANLKANATRVTELAEAIHTVQQPANLYARSGVSEFRRSTQHELFGLTVRNLELMHRDSTTDPFLSIAYLRFRKGDWTYLKGASGSGKTCLLKAINGLWPHGRGDIILPENVDTLYAAQDVKLPAVTLKQLVCLPRSASEFTDVSIAAALHRAGMGDFIEYLSRDARDGTSWDQLLSGGQKQKLILARILLHKPGVLFLDEATGALDPQAKIEFHQSILDYCPAITVISIMHELEPPKSKGGKHFYSHVLELQNCRADLVSLQPTIRPANKETLTIQPIVQPMIAAE